MSINNTLHFNHSRLVLADKACVLVIAVSYLLTLLFLLITGSPELLSAFVIPLVGFALLTIARAIINRPRPYEVGASMPILDASTRGKSFPSRHVGSGALICAGLLSVLPPLGVIVGIATVALGVIRVKGGVHYPSDVIVGGLLGFFFGLLAFAF